jgi:hypothetical protein
MRFIRFLVWSVTLASPLSAFGQIENHLILKKNGLIDKMHFFTGDPITIIREGNKYAEEFYIQGIGTDFIIIGGTELPISQISTVLRRNTGFNFDASGKALLIAAPGYLIIGIINSLFQRVNILPSTTNLIVTGSLLGAGAILPVFQVRKFPIGRKFSLRVVPSDPAWYR